MGLFTKNSSQQAKQSIPHTTVTFYSNCMKMCEDFAPELWQQKNWTLHHENTSLMLPFSPGNFFTKNNMTVVPHPPYLPDLARANFSLFPRLKIKL
jgi:hypothetical protein